MVRSLAWLMGPMVYLVLVPCPCSKAHDGFSSRTWLLHQVPHLDRISSGEVFSALFCKERSWEAIQLFPGDRVKDSKSMVGSIASFLPGLPLLPPANVFVSMSIHEVCACFKKAGG